MSLKEELLKKWEKKVVLKKNQDDRDFQRRLAAREHAKGLTVELSDLFDEFKFADGRYIFFRIHQYSPEIIEISKGNWAGELEIGSIEIQYLGDKNDEVWYHFTAYPSPSSMPVVDKNSWRECNTKSLERLYEFIVDYFGGM